MRKILGALVAVAAVAAFSGVAAPSADAWSCTVFQGAPYVGGTGNKNVYETYGIQGGCSATSIDLTALYVYRFGTLIGTTSNFSMIFYPFTYVYGTTCGYTGPVTIKANSYWVGWGTEGVASGYITGKVYAAWCGSGNMPQVARVYPEAPTPNMVCCDETCCPGGTKQTLTLSKW